MRHSVMVRRLTLPAADLDIPQEAMVLYIGSTIIKPYALLVATKDVSCA
jgi:hypothetical protein